MYDTTDTKAPQTAALKYHTRQAVRPESVPNQVLALYLPCLTLACPRRQSSRFDHGPGLTTIPESCHDD